MNQKSILSFIAFSFLLVLSVSFVIASPSCDYEDQSGCKISETLVKGMVYFAEDNQPAKDAKVTIECNHGGSVYTKDTKTMSYGLLKGTYFVIFSQTECVKGDEVRVSAVKEGLTGQEEGTIKDWITSRCLDIDVGIINVPLVPEFGLFVGALTIMGAVGVFFFVRRQ